MEEKKALVLSLSGKLCSGTYALWAVLGVGGTWAQVGGSYRGWFWVVLGWVTGSRGGCVSRCIGSCGAALNGHLSCTLMACVSLDPVPGRVQMRGG